MHSLVERDTQAVEVDNRVAVDCTLLADILREAVARDMVVVYQPYFSSSRWNLTASWLLLCFEAAVTKPSVAKHITDNTVVAPAVIQKGFFHRKCNWVTLIWIERSCRSLQRKLSQATVFCKISVFTEVEALIKIYNKEKEWLLLSQIQGLASFVALFVHSKPNDKFLIKEVDNQLCLQIVVQLQDYDVCSLVKSSLNIWRYGKRAAVPMREVLKLKGKCPNYPRFSNQRR